VAGRKYFDYRGGDVITHVDQKEVKDAEELIKTIREKISAIRWS